MVFNLFSFSFVQLHYNLKDFTSTTIIIFSPFYVNNFDFALNNGYYFVNLRLEQKAETGDINKPCIGSGFVVSQKSKNFNSLFFLITNKHVIFEKKQIIIRFNSNDGTSSNEYPVTLETETGSKHYSGHPNKDIDIVAIGLDFSLLNYDGNTSASFDCHEHLLSLAEMKNSGVDEGALVYALGFPVNLVDYIKTPISRLGSISKIQHLFRNINEKTYIIDAHDFLGNSGGPVISRPEFFKIKGTPNRGKSDLIGIVCSNIVYTDHALSAQTNRIRLISEENTGLTVVHPVDFIYEVIDKEEERLNK